MRRLARWLVLSAVIFGALFALAGRSDLPRLWATASVVSGGFLVGLFLVSEEMTRERLKRGNRTADPVLLTLVRLTAISVFVVGPLDAGRWHWSDTVPGTVSAVALTALAAAFLLALAAVRANRFFVPQVRIQTERGHHVVDAGPYRVVRHPGYAAMTVFAPAAGLAMGSWAALIPGIACAAAFAFRAAREDRFLHENLSGYTAYAARVRYRLVPGLW